MKNTFYILLALLICTSSVSAQKKSTKEREGLKGDVYTVRLESFVLSSITGKKEPLYGATIYTYDTGGYKIQEDHLTTDGSLSRQILFSYDAENRIAVEADYLADGSLREKTIYTYDNDGKTAEASVYESDGSLSTRIIFRFDLNYNLTELAGLQGVIRFHREGVWIEADQYDPSGLLLQVYTAVNKASGREITYQPINPSSEDQHTTAAKLERVYDTNGNLTDRFLLVQGQRIEIRDDKERTELNRQPEYEFDLKGNWTKKVFWSGGETHVEYRTITYF